MSWASSRRRADDDQGRLAAARPGQPPRPDRRRSGRLARRDPAHGRDQRRLRRADPRRPSAARRDARTTTAPTSGRARGRAGGPPRAKPDPPGHRPGRHDRDVPAAQPDDRRRTGTGARATRARSTIADRPAARCAASGQREAAPRLDPDRARWSATGSATSAARRRRRSTPPATTSSSSASSTATRSARSPPSSRRTSTGWPATVTRDPELVAAARVIQADLDARGVARRPTRRPPAPAAAPRRARPGDARSPPDTGGRSVR